MTKRSDLTTARNAAFDAGEIIGRLIVQAKSSTHPLKLAPEIVAKLSEAQQALFAAQRLMEKPIVTKQTVWERGDYCQLCGQRIDDNKPCGCGARRET